MKKAQSFVEFLANHPGRNQEILLLREIMLDQKLEETIKWGIPVYMHNKKNVAGIVVFKFYTGIWFYLGSMLSDNQRKLVSAQEKGSGTMRQWHFASADEIGNEAALIAEYLEESIVHLDKGTAVKPAAAEITIPEDLNEILKNDSELESAFHALSNSKRREYADYIESAKREATRVSRLEKIVPLIRRGEGLNDKYNR